MASCIAPLVLFWLFISVSSSLSRTLQKPKAFILPVSKDATTLQYATHINMGTPLAKKSFVVDLGGPNFWMDCDDGKYISSSFKRSQCGSAPCSVAKATCGGGCLPGTDQHATMKLVMSLFITNSRGVNLMLELFP